MKTIELTEEELNAVTQTMQSLRDNLVQETVLHGSRYAKERLAKLNSLLIKLKTT